MKRRWAGRGMRRTAGGLAPREWGRSPTCPALVGKPLCPECEWQDVRLSYRAESRDFVLGTFSIKSWRCRSCGSRFHQPRPRYAGADEGLPTRDRRER